MRCPVPLASSAMLPPSTPALAFAFPGLPEMAIFAVIVLVLFGKRLPGAMRSLGQSVGELKKGLHEGEEETPAAPPALDNSPKTPTAV